MKDRLITAVGAIAAGFVVYLLFFGGAQQMPATRPMSAEPGRNGYLALQRWLEQQSIPVLSWRERFDVLLDSDALSPSGNVMLTTMPHRLAVRLTEEQILRGWIRRGNTLIVAAALNDSPEWLTGLGGVGFIDSVYDITGLRFNVAPDPDLPDTPFATLGTAIQPQSAVVFDALEHPLMDGVSTLQGWSDGLSSIWTPTSVETLDAPVLRLAVERTHGQDAIWQRAIDDGQIILVSSGSMFTNHQIAESDADRFLANIVARHLERDGTFVFDDMHQGLTDLYDPAAFYADSRVHATGGFLIALWLAYLLGATNRLAPVRTASGGPRQTHLLSAVGGFMARRLDRRDAGLLLLDDWFREIRKARAIEGRNPPWPELAATPTLSRKLLGRLRRIHARLERGEAVDLVDLHNLVRQARKAIG